MGFISLRRKQNKRALEWCQKMLSILTDEAAERSPAEKLQLSKAYNAIEASFYNILVINYFLNHFVFSREAKQFPHKLISSAWDLSSSARSKN